MSHLALAAVDLDLGGGQVLVVLAGAAAGGGLEHVPRLQVPTETTEFCASLTCYSLCCQLCYIEMFSGRICNIL